jgi:ferric-dicitrate binding protein FerR (iron transport regulator)
MKRDLTHALDECMALLGKGQATLEECLAHYPECASDLRPLLELALELQGLPRPSSSPAAFGAGKQRMLDALAEKRRQAASLNPFTRHVERIISLVADWLKERARPAVQTRTPAFRRALAGALALALFAIGGSVLLFWPGMSVAQMAALNQTSGAVEFLPAGSDTWRPVLASEQLEAGSQVRTGPRSAARLRFFDGSTTDLGARVEVAIIQMNARRDGGKTVILLRQTSGQTHSHVRRLPDQASRFEITTPAAVVTVHGTEFTTTVETDGTTSVAVAEGLVEVTAQGTTVLVSTGQQTTVQPGRPPSTPAMIPPAVPTPAPSPTITPTATTTAPSTPAPMAPFIPTSTPQPPGQTKTPLPPGQTKTPLPPGQTKTPLPPGQTKTPLPPGLTETPLPPGLTETPLPPGQTKTPQPPGQTKTPQPPGQTKTPQPPGQDKESKPKENS